MEYELQIWCEECTIQLRLKDKYAVRTFESLTAAVQHITEYGHVVKADLEVQSEEE